MRVPSNGDYVPSRSRSSSSRLLPSYLASLHGSRIDTRESRQSSPPSARHVGALKPTQRAWCPYTLSYTRFVAAVTRFKLNTHVLNVGVRVGVPLGSWPAGITLPSPSECRVRRVLADSVDSREDRMHVQPSGENVTDVTSYVVS